MVIGGFDMDDQEKNRLLKKELIMWKTYLDTDLSIAPGYKRRREKRFLEGIPDAYELADDRDSVKSNLKGEELLYDVLKTRTVSYTNLVDFYILMRSVLGQYGVLSRNIDKESMMEKANMFFMKKYGRKVGPVPNLGRDGAYDADR